MVTKLNIFLALHTMCYILAKNHMVTKRMPCFAVKALCYILAKNHMVTKPSRINQTETARYILWYYVKISD